jgi:DinB family protein
MSGDDQQAVLADFDNNRVAFEEAVRRAPDAALRYRPAGDDYALGGLVVHVAQSLRHYANVLAAIRAADWQALSAPPFPSSDEDAALIRDGFGGEARAAVLGEMRSAHAALVDAVEGAGADAFRREVAVTYSSGSEPFATSPALIVGWVNDHYKEHIAQVTELVSAWADATR